MAFAEGAFKFGKRLRNLKDTLHSAPHVGGAHPSKNMTDLVQWMALAVSQPPSRTPSAQATLKVWPVAASIMLGFGTCSVKWKSSFGLWAAVLFVVMAALWMWRRLCSMWMAATTPNRCLRLPS